MSLKLVSDETRTLALFASDDSKIGFYCRTTRPDRLATDVFKAMYGKEFDREHVDEVSQIVTKLLSEGYVHFEDGWIELRTGLDDVVSFYTAKLQSAKEEEDFADKCRFEEMQKRKTAEEWYADLCTALTRALGVAGATDVRGKIAYATAGATSPSTAKEQP